MNFRNIQVEAIFQHFILKTLDFVALFHVPRRGGRGGGGAF